MRVEFVSDGQLFLHICVWMCDVGGLFICVYVFPHLYARERLFCPCVLMSVRQEIMCASLRERESVPRSCSAWVDEGGVFVHPDPSFRGSRVVVWNHFLPLWSIWEPEVWRKCEGQSPFPWAATGWNKKWSAWASYPMNALRGTSLILQICAPHPHRSPHHPQLNPPYTPPRNNKQSLRAPGASLMIGNN